MKNTVKVTSLVIRIAQSKNRNPLSKPLSGFRKKQLGIKVDNFTTEPPEIVGAFTYRQLGKYKENS